MKATGTSSSMGCGLPTMAASPTPGTPAIIYGITGLEHFFAGLVTTCMFAFMMSKVDRSVGATHFTLLAAVEVLEDDAPLFGLVPDATYITNPSGFTSGGNTFTAPAGKFTSADIGKLIYCTRTGSGYTTPILPVTTITAVSGTTVTTTATWTEAYSGGISYELVWGTDNDAALVQMGAYAVAKRIMRWPAGGIILRKCYIDIGSIDMPFAMRGAGIDATTLFLATGFDFSTTNAHAWSSMLVKSDAIARDEDYRGFFGDFTVRGPLHKYASATSYNGLAQVWNEGSIQNVHIESLHGVYADIRCQQKTSLFNVRCKQALEGGTHGIMSVAPVTGYQVHTGNCSGSGLLILNVSGDATFAQDPVNFVNSLFDECDGKAVTVENSGRVQFIGCSMFGGPNTVSWALEVKTSGSVVSLIGSQATGYGTASPRKPARSAARTSASSPSSTTTLVTSQPVSTMLVCAPTPSAGSRINSGTTARSWNSSTPITGFATGADSSLRSASSLMPIAVDDIASAAPSTTAEAKLCASASAISANSSRESRYCAEPRPSTSRRIERNCGSENSSPIENIRKTMPYSAIARACAESGISLNACGPSSMPTVR